MCFVATTATLLSGVGPLQQPSPSIQPLMIYLKMGTMVVKFRKAKTFSSRLSPRQSARARCNIGGVDIPELLPRDVYVVCIYVFIFRPRKSS